MYSGKKNTGARLPREVRLAAEALLLVDPLGDTPRL